MLEKRQVVVYIRIFLNEEAWLDKFYHTSDYLVKVQFCLS